MLVKFLSFLPKKMAHQILYYVFFRKKLDLSNPMSLNEKIHWLEVYQYGAREAMLTDKILVKEYIAKLGISDLYVPKTYRVLDSTEKEKIYDYPDKFVMKCNHGSGDVFVCEKKQDFEYALNKLKILKKQDFSKKLLEYHYSLIKPEIMCEEFLEEFDNGFPLDYKFFCFNGDVKCVMVCSNRKNGYKATFFDRNWHILDYSTHPSDVELVKPKNFERMWEVASEISKEEKFVRVDLYNINGKIYFSEMTFSPAAGLSTTYTKEADNILGSYLKLS